MPVVGPTLSNVALKIARRRAFPPDNFVQTNSSYPIGLSFRLCFGFDFQDVFLHVVTSFSASKTSNFPNSTMLLTKITDNFCMRDMTLWTMTMFCQQKRNTYWFLACLWIVEIVVTQHDVFLRADSQMQCLQGWFDDLMFCCICSG